MTSYVTEILILLSIVVIVLLLFFIKILLSPRKTEVGGVEVGGVEEAGRHVEEVKEDLPPPYETVVRTEVFQV